MENKICASCNQKGCELKGTPIDNYPLEQEGIVVEPDKKDDCIAHACPEAAKNAYLAYVNADKGIARQSISFVTWHKWRFSNAVASSRMIDVAPGEANDGDIHFTLRGKRIRCTNLKAYIKLRLEKGHIDGI